ncbi:MAG: hypothetical protein ACK5MG_02380 [Bacteroidales bacterium]
MKRFILPNIMFVCTLPFTLRFGVKGGVNLATAKMEASVSREGVILMPTCCLHK